MTMYIEKLHNFRNRRAAYMTTLYSLFGVWFGVRAEKILFLDTYTEEGLRVPRMGIPRRV